MTESIENPAENLGTLFFSNTTGNNIALQLNKKANVYVVLNEQHLLVVLIQYFFRMLTNLCLKRSSC